MGLCLLCDDIEREKALLTALDFARTTGDKVVLLKQYAALARPSDTRRCVWTRDSTYDYYNTGCGQAFTLNDGTPAENDMRFCSYCGGELADAALNAGAGQ
jgi:hypothetical protein